MFKSNKYYRSEITLKNQPGILDGDLSKDSALIAKLFNEWVDEMTETPEDELERENIYISLSQNIDDYDRFCADMYLNGRCKSDARITKRLLKNRIELCRISINYDKQRKVQYNRLIERAENLIEQLDISMPDLPDSSEAKEIKAEVMDLSKFDNLFIPTMTEPQKDRFKKDIETFVSTYKDYEIVALASVLHPITHKNIVSNKNFSQWLKLLCSIIGRKTPTAKQSNPKVVAEIPQKKKAYYYLFDKIP